MFTILYIKDFLAAVKSFFVSFSWQQKFFQQHGLQLVCRYES